MNTGLHIRLVKLALASAVTTVIAVAPAGASAATTAPTRTQGTLTQPPLNYEIGRASCRERV